MKRENEKIIVLTHQGPFLSPTSAENQYGSSFSSGSPGLQRAYDEYSSDIALWLHGHSH